MIVNDFEIDELIKLKEEVLIKLKESGMHRMYLYRIEKYIDLLITEKRNFINKKRLNNLVDLIEKS